MSTKTNVVKIQSMKKSSIKTLIIATLLSLSVPNFVQAQKEKLKEKDDKKDVEQIIITRKGDADTKTIIEITGDKIIVNGKDIKDMKDGDITVHRNKLKTIQGLNNFRAFNDNTNFGFDYNNDFRGMTSLFREDSNRAMLGVVTDENDKGAEITEVRESSAAEKAGLKKGDVLTKIDDKKIENAGDVSEAVREKKPGDNVIITLLRDGKEQKVNAVLGKYKGIGNAFTIAPGKVTPPDVWRTIPRNETTPFELHDLQNNLNYLNNRPRLGISIQDSEDGNGVKILKVQEESNAAKAGVQKDDVITHVNDTAVTSADEVTKLVRESKDKNSVMLKISRGGKTYNFEVRSPKKLKTTSL